MIWFDSGDDLTDRTFRWGCLGSLILSLMGMGLIIWGGSLILGSETNWLGWVILALGVILAFLGGGWTFFEWIWFP